MIPAVIGLFTFCLVDTKGNLGGLYSGDVSGNKAWYILNAINAGLGVSKPLFREFRLRLC